jgi:hypothetical protein
MGTSPVTLLADTIATSIPRPIQPAPLYAHGGPPGLRKFLYEHEEPAVVIRLGPPPDEETRLVLNSAVDRINALHVGLSSQFSADNDLAPSEKAAVGAITSIYAISPQIPAQIFPLPGGGLQVEWHHGRLDVEIECLADGSTYVYLATDKKAMIDEQASGQRASELLVQVRQALADAAAGYSGRRSTIHR